MQQSARPGDPITDTLISGSNPLNPTGSTDVIPDGVNGIRAAVGYRGVTACAAAGITYRQLDYWARTGLVVPSVRDASGSGTQRLYSFRDIVVLKVVKRLLDAGVSLQNIRKAIETLRQWGEEDLATMTLISDGTTVYECRSAEEVVDLLQGGQGVFGIAIGGAFKEIQGSLADLPVAGGVQDEQVVNANVDAVEGSPTMDELAARRARRRAG
jgi:DNA-binding transcriptional MerR regulator